jgi:glycosyltransferase involved in cell wall biosynthesis
METNTRGEIQPLISVVMPVYNTEQYLAESISSILAQTYSHFEFIIVIDDGSTDNSAAIAREFAARDSRIRLLCLPRCNQAQALNAGLRLASGGWIAYMEADDIALPQRLALQLDWIRRSEADVCGGLAKRFGNDERILWFPETHQAICNELLFRCVLLPSTVMMRADIARATLFDEEAIFLDYEMWTRLAPHYRIGNMQQVLAKYRRHPLQTSMVKASQVGRDLRKFRQPYFHALFPEAQAEDYAAIVGVAEKESFSNLIALERAGEWLLRLAQTPDNLLRKRMADRWRAACQRSAHLGMGCYRLYHQIAPQFGELADQRAHLVLWLLCALRLRPDSGAYLALVSFKRRMANLRVAASNSGKNPWLDLDH